MTTKGAFVAAAVAGMFAAGVPAVVKAADGDKVKCAGVNACKGKSACHGEGNACAGQNACKGKGWIETSEKECKAKKGKILK